jgi:purine-cytosine permease-like protein
MVISRAAFGRRGNFVPALLSWFTVVGWEAVNIVLGAFALYSLFELFGFTLGTTAKVILLAILVVFTFTVAVLGHATIAFFQKIFTWALGLLVLSIVPQVLQAPSLSAAPELGASFATLSAAFTLVAAMPVSYANCPAEYARYLPRRSATGAISFWTFIGAYVPAVIITLIGYLAGTVTDLTDPIAGFKPLLEPWHFALFVIAVIGGASPITSSTRIARACLFLPWTLRSRDRLPSSSMVSSPLPQPPMPSSSMISRRSLLPFLP